MTASVRMLPSQATDFREEGYTVFTADVKAAFLKAHMKDGDVVEKSLHDLRSAPSRWQDHLEQIAASSRKHP